MSFQEGKIPATLTVLTRNSAKTLEKALESAKDFDDIIVCDGDSTDNTLDIARRYGAQIISQDPAFLVNGKIFDYAGLHNQMLAAAKHNWILSLDSDERCGEDLIAAIRKVVNERSREGVGVFWVNRKYVLSGTIIECAATYPNRQMRFFSKSSTSGYIKRIHERIKLNAGIVPEFLDGHMYLPFEMNIPDIRKKWDYQIAVAAKQAAPLSLRDFLDGCFHTAKVSALWFTRLAYNALFCSGTKMPFRFEMERHYFHIRLIRALWRVVKL